MPRFCIFVNEDGEKCTKRSGFNMPGKSPEYCNDHKTDDMINTNNKRCNVRSCYFEAKYSKDGEKPTRCENHKLEDDVNTKNVELRCEKCSKRASFNFYDSDKAKFCGDHLLDGMVNFNHRNSICKFKDDYQSPDCTTRASFGYSWERKPVACRLHANIDMINLISKKCIYPSCNLIASFGDITISRNPTHCSIHKLENMIDVNHCCGVKDCYNKAKYGNYKKVAIRCEEHKEDHMLISRPEKKVIICSIDSCRKEAKYNFKTEDNVKYCNEHKEDNMCDITHKGSLCIVEDCIKRASFGIETISHCSNHKEEDMIDLVHSNSLCDHLSGCGTRATFGFKESNATKCSEHKLALMENKYAKMCKDCNVFQASFDKYTYCSHCFYNRYPEHEKSKFHKTKESKFMIPLREDIFKYLEHKELQNTSISLNKIIKGGNFKRRPDMLIELSDKNIVIEIDEDQHATYSYVCENRRIAEIFMDLNNKPLIIVRLNPDKYITNKVKHLSCFALNKKTRAFTLKKTEFENRYNKLLKEVKLCIDNTQEKEITEIKLFFDDYNE